MQILFKQTRNISKVEVEEHKTIYYLAVRCDDRDRARLHNPTSEGNSQEVIQLCNRLGNWSSKQKNRQLVSIVLSTFSTPSAV